MNETLASSGAGTADGQPIPPGARDTRHGRTGDTESVSGLFSELWRHSTTLVQEEVELAKAELSEKTTHVAVSAGAIAIGGAVLFAGFIVLLQAAVNALAPLLPPDISAWLAPAIIGLVVIVIGFVMVSGGIKALDMKKLAPRRTMDSLRRDTDMVKEHV
ncbi:phage holin family protein [Variovorax sp. DT-64]|uniref:phage holin family protein n=1 Tax=Variovorax sp. DT-64 TaxID=3396160 RepID=UPI003F1C2758